MKLSERMRKHGDADDFTSVKAVYEWADEVALLEAENERLKTYASVVMELALADTTEGQHERR